MPRSEMTAELSKVNRLIAVCIFLSIVALPIDVFPWIFPDSYTLRHLAVYPVAVGCIAAVPGMIREWRHRREFLWLGALGAGFLGWVLLTSLLNAPHPGTLKAFVKLLFSAGVWWGIGIFYGTAFLLFPRNFARKLFLNALLTVSVLCIAYSIWEIAWLCRVPGTEPVLLKFNTLFRRTCFAWEWWPPELWAGRVRSLFAEPSFLTLFATPALILLWGHYLEERKKGLYFVLSLALGLLIYLSFSRTGWMTMFFALGIQAILLERCGIFRGKTFLYRVAPYGKAAVGIILGASAFYAFTYMPLPYSPQKAQTDSVANPAQTTKNETVELTGGSIAVRKTCLQAELKLIAAKPLIGYGVASHGPRLLDHLKEISDKNQEILRWEKDGSCPLLNLYTGTGVEYGVVGAILFFGLCSFPLWLFMRRRLDWFDIASIAALCGLLLAGMTLMIYIHMAFQLFWGVALAAAIRGENR